ncbi:MAG: hypothetical protein RR415_10985 [Ruthenibacterium sp.]
MATARSKKQWEHTSTIVWAVASVMHDPKNGKISPDDFNPYYEKKKQVLKVDGHVLRDIFCSRPKGQKTITVKEESQK